MSPYRFCLWGHRSGYVQIGGELDRAIWPAWRSGLVWTRVRAERRREYRRRIAIARFSRMTLSMRDLGDALAKLGRAGVSAADALRGMRAAADAWERRGRSIATRSQGDR